MRALEAIQAHIADTGYDEIPEGFMTVEQVAELWSKSPRHARVLLKHAQRNNLIESRTFRVGGRKVWHFRAMEG